MAALGATPLAKLMEPGSKDSSSTAPPPPAPDPTTGGVVSTTTTRWVQVVLLPQQSVAVQTMVLTLEQALPLPTTTEVSVTFVPQRASKAVGMPKVHVAPDEYQEGIVPWVNVTPT